MANLRCPQCDAPYSVGAVVCMQCNAVVDETLLNADLAQLADRDGALDVPSSFEEKTDAVPMALAALAAAKEDPAPPESPFQPAALTFDEAIHVKTGAIDLPGVVTVPTTASTRGKASADFIEPTAVLAFVDASSIPSLGLSPFELHVASFIDGGRSVARIETKAGLSRSDLTIALTMLADRNILRVVAHMKPDLKDALKDELDDTGDDAIVPAAAVAPPAPPPRSRTPTPVDAKAARVQQLLHKALDDLRSGKKQSAIAYLHMARELDPKNAQVVQLIATWGAGVRG